MMLRPIWFVDKAKAELIDNAQSQQRDGFESLMATVAMQTTKSLVHNGYCIVIVGDQIKRNSKYPLSSVVQNTFAEHAPSLNLTQIIVNSIPDIRRARRDHRGVRTENFLIFKKEYA